MTENEDDHDDEDDWDSEPHLKTERTFCNLEPLPSDLSKNPIIAIVFELVLELPPADPMLLPRVFAREILGLSA